MKNIKRNQIDRYLAEYNQIKQMPTPKQGWIKYIRNALGMTAEQLAKRVGVNRRRLVKIEQAEVHDAITVKTLREVAQALNCKLILAIVPRTSIDQIIKEQATQYVKKHLKEVSHHMALESQSVTDQKAVEAQIEDLVQQYLSKSLKIIWDD